MKRPRIIGVMPIKLNNERCPGKNTRLLGGKPLLQYQLEMLLKFKELDSVNVYCSSDEVQKYLPQGVTFVKRPDFLDLPTANFSQIFETFISKYDADIYIYDHATAPFITEQTIKECIDAVVGGKYDSAFCAVKIQDFLWQDGKPLNFDATNIPRSQDIKPIYRETSGVYVFTKEVFMKLHRRIGENPFVKEVSFKESVDINELADFDLAQALVNIDI